MGKNGKKDANNLVDSGKYKQIDRRGNSVWPEVSHHHSAFMLSFQVKRFVRTPIINDLIV